MYNILDAAVLEDFPKHLKSYIDSRLSNAVALSPHKIIVLDDDPTGVQTVHGISVYTDWSLDSIRAGFLENNKLFFILTNSRSFTVEQTVQTHQEIAARIAKIAKELDREYFIISRGDSTLRGHYPIETATLKEVEESVNSYSMDGEILCPFFKEGGRYTINNIHYVMIGSQLIPAGKTEFAEDKTFGYHSSNLCHYIEEKTNGNYQANHITNISLKSLRAVEIPKITQQLLQITDFNKVIVNATDLYDVKVFCIALYQALEQGKHFSYRVAASFVKALINSIDKPLLTRRDMISHDTAHGGLIMVGSHTKKTTAQLNRLRELVGILFIEMNSDLVLTDGALDSEVDRVIHLCEQALSQGQTAAVYTKRKLLPLKNNNRESALLYSVKISEAVQSIVSGLSVTPSFIIAKGGITSSDIGVKALQVKKAKVLGQIHPGIPIWKTGRESKFPQIPYVIFPGNVGEEMTLKEIVSLLY